MLQLVGVLMRKSEDEAYQLLENMAINNFQWPSEIATSKKSMRMYEVDVFSNLAAQVFLLTKQLQATQLQNMQASATAIQACTSLCEFCNGPHLSSKCQVGNHLCK